MSGPPKVVLMVKGFTWGIVKQADADTTADIFVRELRSAMVHDPKTKENHRAAMVDVVHYNELEQRLGTHPNPDIVVFPSRGAVVVARRLAAERPRLKIVVLTGKIPDGEVLFVDKGWDDSTIRQVILGR